MTADDLFQIATGVSALTWLALIFLPWFRVVSDTIAAVVVPCLFAVAYIVLLARFFDPAGFSNFSSLEGLQTLQSQGGPWLLVAGWLHYLAFDLVAGAWQVRTARADSIRHVFIVPSLILTYLAGPAGLLVFVVTRYALKRRIASLG